MEKLKIAFVCLAVFSNMPANAKIWDLFNNKSDNMIKVVSDEVSQQPLNSESNGSTTGLSPAYLQEDAKRKADDGQRQAEAERARHIAEKEAKRKAEADRARHSTAAEAKLEVAKSTAQNTSLSGKQGIRILESKKSPSETTFQNVFQIQ